MEKLIDLVNELQAHADLIKRSYPNAFPQEVRAGYTMQLSRFAWEVRVGAGHAALEKAIAKLKTACGEADHLKPICNCPHLQIEHAETGGCTLCECPASRKDLQ